MQIGRCIRISFGYVGCGADVKHVVERQCAGRRQCAGVGVDSFYDLRNCPEDLNSYLEVEYSCLPGETLWHFIASWLTIFIHYQPEKFCWLELLQVSRI